MDLQTWLNIIGITGGAIGLIGVAATVFMIKRQETLIKFLSSEVEARKSQNERLEHERDAYRKSSHDSNDQAQALSLRNRELEARTDLTAVTVSLTKIIEAIDKTNARLDQQNTEWIELTREHTNVCMRMGESFQALTDHIQTR